MSICKVKSATGRRLEHPQKNAARIPETDHGGTARRSDRPARARAVCVEAEDARQPPLGLRIDGDGGRRHQQTGDGQAGDAAERENAGSNPVVSCRVFLVKLGFAKQTTLREVHYREASFAGVLVNGINA